MGSRKIIWLDVTDSTNAAALTAGEQGAAPGTVVVADSQTDGRGRLNRSWLSPPGMGLYFSVVLRPALAVEDLPKITLAVGLAVSKAVEAEYDVSPQIKWPNDLLLGERKFGGILTETGSLQTIPSGQHPLVVVGVGLNLFPPEGGFPPELKERATSLSLHADRKIARELLIEACVKAIEEMLQRLEADDFPAILSEWMQRDATKDRILNWVTPMGKEVTGVSLGPGPDGLLHIRDAEGAVHAVLSGDVSLVGKIPERQP